MATDTAEQSATLIQIGDMLIDEASGEIIDPGSLDTGAPPIEQIERMHGEYLFAKEQAETWETTRKVYGRVLDRLLAQANLKKASGDFGTATAVAGSSQFFASVEAAEKAVEEELLTAHELLDLCANAASQLNPEKVRAWLDTNIVDEKIRKALALILIKESKRAGYVLAKPPRKAAPAISRRARGEDE